MSHGRQWVGQEFTANVLSGLESVDGGRIVCDGEDVTDVTADAWTALRLRRIGMVFQEHNLVPQFAARENIDLILRAQGGGAKDEAGRLLGLVGRGDLGDRRPADMSGGQRQRVGVARALAGDRSFLLCDEPTGSLDSATSAALFALLADVAHDGKVGVLVATHDQIGARYADRVLRIVDGQIAS